MLYLGSIEFLCPYTYIEGGRNMLEPYLPDVIAAKKKSLKIFLNKVKIILDR